MGNRLKKQHAIFDIEIIGKYKPVFLVCVKIIETQETFAFWQHKRGDLKRFLALVDQEHLTWVSFNGIKFDAPLIAAWINGRDANMLKMICMKIVDERMMPWESYKLAGMDGLKFDHIDLIEVAPGVMTSLKTYAGRMDYPSMVDLPFHHDDDLTPAQCKVLEAYCKNDLGVTEALFHRLKDELALRAAMSIEYGMDLRSKSDAQIAEAILKQKTKIGKTSPLHQPYVEYRVPDFIRTTNPQINALIEKLEDEKFFIDSVTHSPILPAWLEEPFALHGGSYQVGIGGLHSKHDKQVCHLASDDYLISDIDAEAYYPTTILNCGLVPKMGGNKGDAFIAAYREIYERRREAKRIAKEGQRQIDLLRENPKGLTHKDVKKEYLRLVEVVQVAKSAAQSLKIAQNGAYGKLGSIYSPFYSPDLMLAVCLTGQLNLLCLIDTLSRLRGVSVLSANTDGIMVGYKASMRDKVLAVVTKSGKQTGFNYEETRYAKAALKDVNNYIAIGLDGYVKSKGLYAPAGLQKNPTAPVCSQAAAEYLKNGTRPEKFIAKQKKLEPFLAIRNVKGGGIQHTKFVEADDWVNVEHKVWHSPSSDKVEKRVSRPKPFAVGQGGKPFGRVARWYMSTKAQPPLTYVSNGNQVPKTQGAQLCMTLPLTLPIDLDRAWYVQETYEMLNAMGVTI